MGTGLRLSIILLVTLLAVAAADTPVSETARVLSKGQWVETPVRTVDAVEGFKPGAPVPLSQYGGWLDGKAQATGFFHTQEVDGRWWLVDPEGCLFISVGLNSVNRVGANRDLTVADQRFGDVANWAAETLLLLKGRGFNSLGCWSDWQPFRDGPSPMPYFPRWNFMQTYKNKRDEKRGPRGYPNQCMPLFDPEFVDFCDRHAEQLAATRDDPWLVGHFSDNELPFRPNLLDLYLELPETDTGRQAAAEWLAENRKQTGRDEDAEITVDEQDGFLEFAARRYYSVVGAAIRKHDPNHLYVGSRIHGRTICLPMFRGAASAVDVMSVNYYHRWSAEHERVTEWVRAAGMPFLVSEWYAMQLDTPTTPGGGAGFRVPTQRERGLFYQNMAISLLEHPGCVGWHWFKYGGDGDGFSAGVVSRQYEPHDEFLSIMQALNEQVYPLAAHFRKE